MYSSRRLMCLISQMSKGSKGTKNWTNVFSTIIMTKHAAFGVCLGRIVSQKHNYVWILLGGFTRKISVGGWVVGRGWGGGCNEVNSKSHSLKSAKYNVFVLLFGGGGCVYDNETVIIAFHKLMHYQKMRIAVKIWIYFTKSLIWYIPEY